MKRLLICFSILAFAPSLLMAQKVVNERDVPEKIVKDFTRKVPEATNPKWEQFDSVTFQATYAVNNAKTSLRFTNVSVETRWDINLEWMPEKIKNYIDTAYTKAKIESLCIADVQNKKTYEANIKQKKVFHLLRFEIDGTFIDATEINLKKKK